MNNNTQTQILIADDDPAIVASLRLLLSHSGFAVVHANSPQETLFLAQQHAPALLLIDMNYQHDTTSGHEGLDLLAKLKEWDEHTPVVVMTGWATIDLAVAAMQKGASDFVQKPWDNNRLLSVIKTQLKIAEAQRTSTRLSRENQILKEDKDSQTLPMVAESDAMHTLLKQCQQAALSDASILINGENGTGKSVLAEYIHQHSDRAQQPFIAVNMGAIPESLFESELFGHAKGAFTDAKTKRIGRVELAEGGTLFLDEIGNLPLSQQSKLLQLLENKSYQPVGSSLPQTANVRVIAATNANLEQMVQDKQFRMDLMFRLNTLTMTLPPLRERPQDILPLAASFCEHFAAKYQKSNLMLSENAKSALTAYSWPGNIRELSHVIERCVLFSETREITADSLMLHDAIMLHDKTLLHENQEKTSTQETPHSDSNCHKDNLATMADIEKKVMQERLDKFDGNANLAAESLGLSRSAFYRRLDKYKLQQ